MGFTDLSLSTQNLLLSNHDYLTKWLLFLFLICFSCYYLFYLWGRMGESIYFSVFLGRMFLFFFSIVYLVVSPLTLLLMTPELNFQDFYGVHLILYFVCLGIVILALVGDFFRYGASSLVALVGFNVNDPYAKEVANTFYNNKHFFKWLRRK